MPIRRPGFFAAHVVRYLAEQEGITLPDPQKTSKRPLGSMLAVHQGDDLYTALGRAFRYSNNIAFEMMVLSTTGRTKIRSAAREVLRVVQKNIPEISWSGAILKNASGLSSGTRSFPMQCASMVRYMATTRVHGRFLLRFFTRLVRA